ncbi:MAG: hypothetical protein RL131_1273 [Bacteroidota bacterium]
MTSKVFRILLISFVIPFFASGQSSVSSPLAQDTANIVQILQANTFRRIKQDSAGDLNILVGNVVMRQKNTLFYCDSAIQNMLSNQLEAFGNIHINDNDSVHTYSQYLKYLGNTKFAELKKKVKLTDGKGVLTTEALEYDVNAHIGTYKTGGKVVNGESVLTSKEGVYYANTRDVYFQKNVKLVDPEYTVSTDTLLYNVNSEIARFVSPTKIFDGKSSIETRSGYYDLKQGLADFNKRPVIRDSSQTVIADSINYNKNSGAGMAIGQVDYSDTSQGISMVAGKAEFNNTTKVIKTYQRPLMKFLQEGDSLFVAADTLYSAYLGFDSTGQTNPADTFRFFRAYHHVKIFSDSLQGKCDSLYYSSMDSVFRFFKEPVMWAQESQISGDTIYLFTKNRKADKVQINENAFSVNKSAEGLYNQLRGNSMSGQFINGEIDFLRSKGNSESLYYLQEEDSSYMGMNYSQADAIVMKFIGKEIKRVSWINGVTGTTYPMKQIPSDKKELRNFKWLDAIRPKSIGDLLSIQ